MAGIERRTSIGATRPEQRRSNCTAQSMNFRQSRVQRNRWAQEGTHCSDPRMRAQQRGHSRHMSRRGTPTPARITHRRHPNAVPCSRASVPDVRVARPITSQAGSRRQTRTLSKPDRLQVSLNIHLIRMRRTVEVLYREEGAMPSDDRAGVRLGVRACANAPNALYIIV